MKEQDPLSSLLREWEAPEPPAALDVRARAAWAARPRAPWWGRIWSAHISVPVPVLAALLVIGLALWLQFRPRPPAVAAPGGSYVTRIETAGFRALPDGEYHHFARQHVLAPLLGFQFQPSFRVKFHESYLDGLHAGKITGVLMMIDFHSHTSHSGNAP